MDKLLAHAEHVDDDLRSLFEWLHGANMKDVEEAQLQDARSEMDAMFEDMGINVDLSGFHPGMTATDVAAKAAQLIDELKGQAPAGQGPRESEPSQDHTGTVAEGLRGALDSLQTPHALKNVRELIREQRAADKALPRLRMPFRY